MRKEVSATNKNKSKPLFGLNLSRAILLNLTTIQFQDQSISQGDCLEEISHRALGATEMGLSLIKICQHHTHVGAHLCVRPDRRRLSGSLALQS